MPELDQGALIIVLAMADGGAGPDLRPFGHVYGSPDQASGLFDEARDVVTHRVFQRSDGALEWESPGREPSAHAL
jgi:hypothetical protein